MTIVLNGEPAQADADATLQELLDELGVDAWRVVVEHNARVVRAPDLGSARLREGDEVEVVRFVGGG
ncbi:MAG TPA: sulfur carrier protein ThiS [Candidatus Dormibacteraeota bacterium]|nr:sulfur carrier protein ThiS [Candidatus Dormibacteraeota bacterium]